MNKAEEYWLQGGDYIDSEEYDKAIEALTTAINLDPRNAGIYNTRGRAYFNMGKYEKALSDFEKASRLDPNESEFRENKETAEWEVREAKRKKEERDRQEKEAKEKAEREAREAKERAEREAKEKAEREEKERQRQQWLKTEEGQKWQAEENKRQAKEKEERERREAKEREERERREAEEREARKRREAEEKRRATFKTFVVIIAIAALISLIVYRSTGSFFKFKQNDQGTLTITGYSGKKEVVIPATNEKGISITEIGDKAFYEKKLKSVIIPDGITIIGDEAFSYNKLTSIVIPNSVTSLSGFANNQLTSVIIPNSVTSIGAYAFYNNQLTSVVISDSVTTIGVNAFANNAITSIRIGANVELGSFSDGFGILGQNTGFNTAYANNGNRAGTYVRSSANNTNWTRISDSVSFPSGFIGTWKRDNYNNSITFTSKTIKASNQDYLWGITTISGNLYSILTGNTNAAIIIKLIDGNIVISNDSGWGEDNWNGTWRKH